MKTLMLVAVSVMLAAPLQMLRAQDARTGAATNDPAAGPSQSAVPATSAGAAGQYTIHWADTQPKVDPAKEADIRQLLELTGATGLAHEVMTNMETNIKPLMTGALPPGDYREKLVQLFFEKFQSKMNDDSLLKLSVARYNENFSDEEIKQLIVFYQTPLGQKIVTVLPKLTQELQQDGTQMGQQLGRESMLEVLQEHPELARALQEAAQRRGSQARP